MKYKPYILSTFASFILIAAAIAEPVTLKVQTPYAPGQQTGKELANWADDVKIMSGGEITIELIYGSSKVAAAETFDAAVSGIIDCDATSGLYQIDKDPAFQFVGDLVGGYNTPWQQYSWLYYGGGYETAQELYNIHGMQLIGWAIHGQESLSSKRPIAGLRDLKGWKFRSPPGMETDVFKEFGASPIEMELTEIIEPLKTGNIEGADAFGLASNVALGLYDVVKHTNYPGFHSMPSEHLACNLEVWNGLSEQQRRIIDVAWQKLAFQVALHDGIANAEAVTQLEDKGVTIYAWSEEDLESFRDTTQLVWERWGDKNQRARDILESHKSYLRQLGILN